MPMLPSPTATARPTVDEWGVYDPQQAGLAALFTRLAGGPVAGHTAPGTAETRTTPAAPGTTNEPTR